MVQHQATTVWHFSAFHYNEKSGKVSSQTSPDFFTSSLLYQLPLTDSAATAPFHSTTPHHAPFAGHTPWAIPHKERLATLHAICLQISRHISQQCSWIPQVFTPLFVSSDEKFDDASVAQSLCGIALDRNIQIMLWKIPFPHRDPFLVMFRMSGHRKLLHILSIDTPNVRVQP